ncbi:uncharacterized protein DS421_13g421840 [Arachis hypogaea]|nr:uncharacterized protein DS421_13g421840 [Arachis hypogaea]
MACQAENDGDINKLNETSHYVGAADFEDVAYHLGLRAHGNPVGGCLRDFGRWYHTETWALVEELLGARPPVAPQQAAQRKESFMLKLVWLTRRPSDSTPGWLDYNNRARISMRPGSCIEGFRSTGYDSMSLPGECTMTLLCRLCALPSSFLTSTGRGEDVWLPEQFQDWYEGWRRRFDPGRRISVLIRLTPGRPESTMIGGVGLAVLGICQARRFWRTRDSWSCPPTYSPLPASLGTFSIYPTV